MGSVAHTSAEGYNIQVVDKWYILPIVGLYATDPTFYGNQKQGLNKGHQKPPPKQRCGNGLLCVAKELRLYSNIVLSGGSTAFQHFKETGICLVDVGTLVGLCKGHCAMIKVIFQAYNLYNSGFPLFWEMISEGIPFISQTII